MPVDPLWPSGEAFDSSQTISDSSGRQRTPTTPVAPQRPLSQPDGDLVPTVVVGLGGAGGAVLRQFQEHCSRSDLPHVRLLHVDVDLPQTMPRHGFVHTPLHRLAHYVKRQPGRPPTAGWLPPTWLRGLATEPAKTEARRYLGRLAFFDHYAAIAQQLRHELRSAANPVSLLTAMKRTGLNFRTERPRVIVVTSLAGGSGSGMFLDVAYVARLLLREFGAGNGEVSALLLLPDVAESTAPHALANTYAALVELRHYSDPSTTFTACYSDAEEGVAETMAPFDRCLVVPQGTAGSGIDLASNLLDLHMTTALGASAARTHAALPPPRRDMTWNFSSAGIYRLGVPRRTVVRHAARALCERLRQAAGSAPALPHLAAPLHDACTRALGGVSAAAFIHATDVMLASGSNVGPGAVTQLLSEVDQWLRPHGILDKALDAATPSVRPAVAEMLAEAQAATHGLHVLRSSTRTTVYAALEPERSQQLAEQFDKEAAELRQRILADTARWRRRRWWRVGCTIPEELVASLRAYPQACYAHLIQNRLARIVALENGLAPPRELPCCQARLARGVRGWRELPEPADAPGLLLPAGCTGIAAAMRGLLERIPSEVVAEMLRQAQVCIGRHLLDGGHLCRLTPDQLRRLLSEIEQSFAVCAQDYLGWGDAADIYLHLQASDEGVEAQLACAYAAAAPAWQPEPFSATEVRLLALPAGTAGARLTALAQAALPEVTVRTTNERDELVMYREENRLTLRDLPHLGYEGQKAYAAFSRGRDRACHSRLDVVDWLPPLAKLVFPASRQRLAAKVEGRF